MRHPLADCDGLSMRVVECAGGARGWEPPEEAGGPGIVFVRLGAFARRVDGAEALLDATVAYFERPGTEEQFAHPAGALDDECFAVDLPPALLSDLGRAPSELPAGPVYTSAAVDLAHRRLAVEAARGCDGFELYERAAGLVGAVLDGPLIRRPAGSPATARARRRLVARAREALRAEPSTGLVSLAREVGSSPHHLSRVFAAETGQTLSAYRNRLRAALVLARLEAGERDLSGLAAELGFADHAHMTRVLRGLVGAPPSALRAVLASG